MSNPEKKGGCGNCLGKGCLVLFIIGAILAGGVIFCYHRATVKARKYTAESGTPVQAEEATQEQYDTLIKRMDDFKNAAPGSNAELALTAHDLNTLIARSPGWALVKGKIFIHIDSNQVGLTGSIPLAFLPELRDRYLNGTLYFTPSMDSKVLHINLQSMKLNSQDVPKDFVKSFSTGLESNGANRLLGDPVIGPVLIRTETLKVEDNTLKLTGQ